jgi:hypothetical protein
MELERVDRTFRWVKKNPLKATASALVLAAVAMMGLIVTGYGTGYFGELGRSKAAEITTSNPQAEWPDAFEQADPRQFAFRRFELLQEPGAILPIGRCPGPKCYQIKLGRMFETERDYRQELILDGGGFAAGVETGDGWTSTWTRYSVEPIGTVTMLGGPLLHCS